EFDCDIPDDVFHEYWILEGLHRDMSFVGTLQKRIDRCRRRGFGDIHQLLNPDDFPSTFTAEATPHLDRHATTLVMRAIVANGFATGTERRDRNIHPKREVVAVAPALPNERAAIVHEGARTGDGGFTL